MDISIFLFLFLRTPSLSSGDWSRPGKSDPTFPPERQAISSMPVTRDLVMRPGDILVLACDGLFETEHLSNDTLLSFIGQKVGGTKAEGRDELRDQERSREASHLTDALKEYVLSRASNHSEDNMTLMAVQFAPCHGHDEEKRNGCHFSSSREIFVPQPPLSPLFRPLPSSCDVSISSPAAKLQTEFGELSAYGQAYLSNLTQHGYSETQARDWSIRGDHTTPLPQLARKNAFSRSTTSEPFLSSPSFTSPSSSSPFSSSSSSSSASALSVLCSEDALPFHDAAFDAFTSLAAFRRARDALTQVSLFGFRWCSVPLWICACVCGQGCEPHSHRVTRLDRQRETRRHIEKMNNSHKQTSMACRKTDRLSFSAVCLESVRLCSVPSPCTHARAQTHAHRHACTH